MWRIYPMDDMSVVEQESRLGSQWLRAISSNTDSICEIGTLETFPQPVRSYNQRKIFEINITCWYNWMTDVYRGTIIPWIIFPCIHIEGRQICPTALLPYSAQLALLPYNPTALLSTVSSTALLSTVSSTALQPYSTHPAVLPYCPSQHGLTYCPTALLPFSARSNHCLNLNFGLSPW
jgi:hypothetical protein